MKRRVIIDLVTEVEENESPSLLYDDIRQELCCCWHDVSFTMKHEDEDEPQIFICPIQDNYEALIEDEPQTEEWYTYQDEQEYNDRWQTDRE